MSADWLRGPYHEQHLTNVYSMLQFLIPRSVEAGLPSFLALLEKQCSSLGVSDSHMRLSSLEEVFLAIARAAELEAAAASDCSTADVVLPDNSVMQVVCCGSCLHCAVVASLNLLHTLL